MKQNDIVVPIFVCVYVEAGTY